MGGPSLGIYPYPSLQESRTEEDPLYHNCSVRHPCSQNGEYFNATCGAQHAGTNASEYVALGQPWTAALDGGWGCTGAFSPPASCVGGVFLFAMAYADVDKASCAATRSSAPAPALHAPFRHKAAMHAPIRPFSPT